MIDLFLGNHLTSNMFDVQVQRELKNRQREYSTYSTLTMSCLSWHCGHYTPSANFEAHHLLGP